ncbi:TPA: hypothetical protein PMD70_002713 [Vibrio cholerae]|nr:hypothetical protein [Vibrio cholerae]
MDKEIIGYISEGIGKFRNKQLNEINLIEVAKFLEDCETRGVKILYPNILCQGFVRNKETAGIAEKVAMAKWLTVGFVDFSPPSIVKEIKIDVSLNQAKI